MTYLCVCETSELRTAGYCMQFIFDSSALIDRTQICSLLFSQRGRWGGLYPTYVQSVVQRLACTILLRRLGTFSFGLCSFYEAFLVQNDRAPPSKTIVLLVAARAPRKVKIWITGYNPTYEKAPGTAEAVDYSVFPQ
jgi:hypothetical protein